MSRKEREDYKLDLKLGDCELEIFGIEDSPARVSYPEVCGLCHLVFRVDFCWRLHEGIV